MKQLRFLFVFVFFTAFIIQCANSQVYYLNEDLVKPLEVNDYEMYSKFSDTYYFSRSTCYRFATDLSYFPDTLYLNGNSKLSTNKPATYRANSVFNRTLETTFKDYFLSEDIVGTNYTFNLTCFSTATRDFSAVIIIGGQQVATATFTVSGEKYKEYQVSVTGIDPNISGPTEVELVVTINANDRADSGLQYGGSLSYILLPPLKSQAK